jgi:hypothetical protein
MSGNRRRPAEHTARARQIFAGAQPLDLAHMTWNTVRFASTPFTVPARPNRSHDLRGDYTFHCSVRCPGAVATDAQDALETVGVADSEYRDAISQNAIIDQVSIRRRLKIGKCPVCKAHDLIGAASGRWYR